MTAPGRERIPDLKFLFPITAWWTHPVLRTSATWLVVALVAVPPFALSITAEASPQEGAYLFALYFAVAWFLVLHVIVRPRGITWAQQGQVAGVALVLGGSVALALERAIHPSDSNVLACIFGIGGPEELAKMLPVVAVLFYVHRRGTALVPRDVLFLGVVSGLVFGALEAVEYVMSGQLGELDAVWRVLTDPVNHALWAGVSGYFLGLAARYSGPGPRWALAGLGLSAAAVLHGVNDWLVFNGHLFFWGMLSIVSALLFLAYAKVGIAPAPARPAPTPTSPTAGWGPPSAATFEWPRPRETGRHAAP